MFSLRQNGAVLIIVLWFIIIVSIIVGALANETRLSAKVVLHNKAGLETWNDTLKALRAAEMELLINRMPDPPGEETPIGEEKKNKRYRFDGREVELAYPIPETVSVRIYDHAGRINLLRLSKRQMRLFLENRIGSEPEKLNALEDAWQDWIDRDDLKHANGAEKDYYETLEPPYEPRNDHLETVEELLLVKGFAEVFKGVEINNAFTVYGSTYKVNPNLATREALMLLPGMNEEIVNTILIKRRETEFKSHNDFKEFMEPEQLVELKNWISFSTSNFYTIAVLVKPPESAKNSAQADENSVEADDAASQAAQPQKNQHAYMVTVQAKGFNQLPKILMVNPYGVLPDTRHELMEDEESSSDKSNGGAPAKKSPFSFF